MSIREELMKRRREEGYIINEEEKNKRIQENVKACIREMLSIFRKMYEKHPYSEKLMIRFHIINGETKEIKLIWQTALLSKFGEWVKDIYQDDAELFDYPFFIIEKVVEIGKDELDQEGISVEKFQMDNNRTSYEFRINLAD